MNRIILTRKNEFNNRFRSILVYINDKTKIRLSNKEKTLNINEGEIVKLKAKIDWCYSPEILVSFNNLQNRKVIISSQISNLYIVLVFLSFLLGGVVAIVKGNWIYLIPFFVLYLRPLYYITLGRKRYLKINIVE